MKKVIILQLFLLFVFSSCRRSQKQYQCTCTFGAYQAVGQPNEPVDIDIVCCGKVICADNSSDAKTKCLQLWQNGANYRHNSHDDDRGCVITYVGTNQVYCTY